MIFTAGLAYFKFHSEVRTAMSRELNDLGKKYGEDILTRISYAADKASEVSRLIEADISLEAMSDEFLTDGFDAIWIVPSLAAFDSNERQYFGIASSTIDVDFLANGYAQFLVTETDDLMLVRALLINDKREFVLFKLTSSEIWGDRTALTYIAEFCVMTASGTQLHCSAPIGEPLGEAFAEYTGEPTENAFIEWQRDGQDMYASRRYLFLAGKFRGEPLGIVMAQQKEFSMQSGSDFARTFFPSVILVFLLAGLFSLSLIGRSLTPLRTLIRSAQSVAQGDFSTRSSIQTRDEFEELGDAFDHMAQRLGQQVSTLEALSSIDQMILAGSDLDQIAERVIRFLHHVDGGEAAAVIAQDPDVPGNGKMICAVSGEGVAHERVVLPEIIGQSSRELVDASPAIFPTAELPYAECFVQAGYPVVIAVPVFVNDQVRGLLIVGFNSTPSLSEPDRQLCIDLAGRFAVALASIEREETLYRQAHYDGLTGLPNRQLLKDRLEQHLSRSRDDSEHGAVFFIDLDRFKEVNDVCGHTVGDTLLCQAAERILSIVRKGDTVARLGGDEFVVIISNYSDDRSIRLTADSLLERLRESFSIGGAEHYLGASIGIALFPSDGTTVETLLRNADAAMYRAKDAGRNRFEFFSRSLNAENVRKINLERDLRIAVSGGDLEVFYQPQMQLANGQISGAEALVRWTHPTLGRVGPDEFIPLAEDSDLIVDLGSFVIERSCENLREILDQGLHPGVLSINVSGRQLADSRFERAVLEPLRRWDIHPGFIQLEITETTVAQNRDIATGILESLRESGVRIALDDFGTGYSSLSYLEHMPFDSLKIDKSFIDRIGASETSDNICNTIIKMAEQLGKKSIAEGVETKSQLQFLTDNGCDVVQGHYYAKPMAFEQFRDFLAAQSFHTQRRRVLEIGA